MNYNALCTEQVPIKLILVGPIFDNLYTFCTYILARYLDLYLAIIVMFYVQCISSDG